MAGRMPGEKNNVSMRFFIFFFIRSAQRPYPSFQNVTYATEVNLTEITVADGLDVFWHDV